jgi:PASTA domain
VQDVFVQGVASTWEQYERVTAPTVEPAPRGLILHARQIFRVFVISVICVVVAAIAPAAPEASRFANVNPLLRANAPAWVAVAIPQSTLEIAATGACVSALSSDGRVAVVADPRGSYLFRASSEGTWGSATKPTARLRVPHSALVNLTAVATSRDGTTVLVAAGAVGNNPAAVYVFHVSSQQDWNSPATPKAKLTNATDPTGFGSGAALSSDGTTALVGEPGGADVFHVATADSWRDSSNPTATLVADGAGAVRGDIGIAVSLSADGATALVGATSLATFVGAAYVFRAAAADAWVSSATPDAVLTDGAAGLFGDGFGGAVALAPDGLTALVGAPNLAFGPAGAAYLFHVRSPDAWTSTADPDAIVDRGHGSGTSGDVPGWSVALSEEGTAVVGEPSVLGEAGAADVVHIAGSDQPWRLGTAWHAQLTNAASPPGELFGASVGLSSDGTTALVSSAQATFIFTRAGSQSTTNCYVPYLQGETLVAAKRAIGSTHCRVGKLTRVRVSRAESNRVISQKPKPGARLPKGATIELRIGNGKRS